MDQRQPSRSELIAALSSLYRQGGYLAVRPFIQWLIEFREQYHAPDWQACPVCGTEWEHDPRQPGTPRQVCKPCTRRIMSEGEARRRRLHADMDEQMAAWWDEAEQAATPTRPYRCEVCARSFWTVRGLTSHQAQVRHGAATPASSQPSRHEAR